MLKKLKKNKSFIAAVDSLNADFKKWKLLGRGAFGFAYDMGDGRVCKITTNEPETKAAAKLKKAKKNFNYLYKILDVLFLKRKDKFWLGLVITPKYKQLTDKQKTELFELFCFLNLPPSFRIKSVEQIKKNIAWEVKEYCYAPYPYDNTSIINGMISRRLKIFRKYNILYILRNLKAANLGPEDMHYENILKDGDHFILIDVAC